MSWEQVKLGDIFEIARGGSPRPIEQYITDDPNGLNWISIKDASNSSKYIYKTEKKIKPEGLHKTRLVHPNDFLLTNSMSFGRPYIMKTTGCIHDGWLVLSADKTKVDTDYFYHLLGSDFMYRKFTGLTAGAVVKNLNTELVKSVSVPLPPLSEQRRIASILDQADELRQKRQQAIEKLDQLLQATFIDMFGDPVTNPKGWEKLSFGHLIKLKSGNGLISQQMNKEGSYPVYGGNGICGTHDTYMFDEPKITIGRVGQYCGSVHTTRPQAWITDNALYVSEYLKEVNIIFLEFILKMAELNQYAGRAAQPLVSGSRIYPVETIYPPMQMQEDFADRIIKIINISRKCTDALVGSDKSFKSFQSRAFIGNL